MLIPQKLCACIWLYCLLMWQICPATISGRIVDTQGKPVAGVAISLDVQKWTTTTDLLGQFTLGTVSLKNHKGSGRVSHLGDLDRFNIQGRALLFRSPPFCAFTSVPLGKLSAISDTLYIAKSNFISKRIGLITTSSDLGDIVLYNNFSGVPEKYHGFDQYRFTVAGKSALVVVPKNVRAGSPWIWRTYFWDHKPTFDSIMCANGYFLAFMDAPNLFGAPIAVALMDSFYTQVTQKYGLSKKTNLVGISRGGLYLYNWARANLTAVSTIYADGAVMDFLSWPCGCYGTGTGSAGDWSLLKTVYGFSSDSAAKAYKGNPYQNMRAFATAKIPIIQVYGETDMVVPPAENVLRGNDSLKNYAWQMRLLPKPNTGHTHGVQAADGGLPGQLDTLVQFVLRNTTY
jgi:hypothetical protein